jgi:multidrug efflux pump subunit AcrA (membrane-fusion protein)
VSADAIIEIADFDTLVMETDVPESRMDRLQREDGKPAPTEITLDAFPSKRFTGHVLEIVPKINRTKATVAVKVAFDGDTPPAGVLPEMAGRVRFLSEQLDQATLNQQSKKLVPESAVVTRNGKQVVFVIDDGKVREKVVNATGPANGFYEIDAEGPSVGTKVVKAPPGDLTDGEKVKERTDG